MFSTAARPSSTRGSGTGTTETTELSEKYETPMGLAHGTMQALKDRIKLHYDLASDYYLSLWYCYSSPPNLLGLIFLRAPGSGISHEPPKSNGLTI